MTESTGGDYARFVTELEAAAAVGNAFAVAMQEAIDNSTATRATVTKLFRLPEPEPDPRTPEPTDADALAAFLAAATRPNRATRVLLDATPPTDPHAA